MGLDVAALVLPSAPGARFLFVLDGTLGVSAGQSDHVLVADDFAFFPAGLPHTCGLRCIEQDALRWAPDLAAPPPRSVSSSVGATVLMYEQRYVEPIGVAASLLAQGIRPQLQVGSTGSQPLLPVDGEVFGLRKLLPTTPEYDFNMHVMTFEPGEFLTVKEVHYNQHGLLLLEGQGIYRLADKWCDTWRRLLWPPRPT